jgi:Barrel-sandwich domain of CusB or HlyD membrane-fusion
MISVGEMQEWLENHCHERANVVGGMVTLTNSRDDIPVVAAQWPKEVSEDGALLAAATASFRGRKSHFPVEAGRSDGPQPTGNVVALPLRVGNRAVGAIALQLNANDEQTAQTALADLQRAAANLTSAVGSQRSSSPPIDAAAALQLQATILSHEYFAEAATAFASELASMLHFDRVVIGFTDGRHATIAAVSGTADFKNSAGLLDAIGAAMDEALEQEATVSFPAAPNQKPRITLAHAEFVRRHGGILFTVPMVSRQKIFGAVSFIRAAGAPPSQAQIAQCEQIVFISGPILELKHTIALPWRKRLWRGTHYALQQIFAPGNAAKKIGAGAALLLVAALLFLPMEYRVSAPARLEGSVQRALVAPADGFLRQVNVRPGDSVKAGQVLAELAEEDLQLERRKWESELAQYENSASAALAHADRTQFVVNQSRADEAQAQLDLVNKQLIRSRVLAPFDGIVIKGDLSQSLGAPVQRGEILLTIAPAGEFRLLVEVDERDIGEVQAGQTGSLALGAFERSLPFRVSRVTPMATARDGRNFFEVEGTFTDSPASLRPGLQGVAKIGAGKRVLGWIWTHRLAEWARMTLWSWGA